MGDVRVKLEVRSDRSVSSRYLREYPYIGSGKSSPRATLRELYSLRYVLLYLTQ